MVSESSAGEEPVVLRVRTFGECVMELGDRRISPDAEIIFAVLLVLVFERGERVAREKLLRLLWPRVPAAREMQRLRQALYKTRQLFEVPIEVTATHVCLDRKLVDADFAPLLDAGWQNHLLTSTPPRGEFLPGYTPTFSAPFAEWIDTQRDLIHTRVRLAMAAAMSENRGVGDWGKVEMLARACLEFDPLNQDATLALAEAIALGGRKSDAIAVLDSYLVEVGEAVGPGTAPMAAQSLRKRIAERLSSEPYLRTSEGVFVGRGASMRILYDCARRTHSGFSTSTFIWGEPGIGKTRLVDEYCRGAAVEGTIVQRVACQASDAQRPLSVFADLVPHLRPLPGALGCSPDSLSFLNRLSASGGETFGASHASEDAEVMASGIRRAIFDIIDAATSECSLLIVAEDLHWADPASIGLLQEIAIWSGSRQLQLLMTSRTPPSFDIRPGNDLSSKLIVHRLPALEQTAAAELLRSLASARGRFAENDFIDWALRVAEGNPFYLRELLSRWLQTNELHSVPPTLASLLTNRIAGLDKRELRLLQACAVLRRHGRPDRLQTLLGYANLDVIESLESLGAAGLIVVQGEHAECRHELIVDAALQQLSDATRQALYRLAAELLEREAAESAGMAVLWDCARLWHQAGDVERAVSSGVSCAERLIQMGCPADAAELLERIVPLCDSNSRLLRVYDSLAKAYRLAASWRALAATLTASRSLRDPVDRIRFAHDDDELLLLEARWRVEGEPRSTLGQAERCLQDIAAAPSHRFRAATLALSVADSMCFSETANQVFAVAETVSKLGGIDPTEIARLELMYHTPYGDLATAVKSAMRHVELEQQTGRPLEHARALRFSSSVFRRAGMHDSAVRALSESLSVARKAQINSAVAATLVTLADCYLDVHDYEHAAQWYELAGSASKDVEDVHLPMDIVGIGVHLAIVGEDPARAVRLSAHLRDLVNSDTVVRRRTYALAIWTLAQVSAKRKVDGQSLGALEELHAVCRQYGAQDTSATALCVALRSSNREGDAALRWHEYVAHYRREKWPIPSHVMLRGLDYLGTKCARCDATDSERSATD